MQMSVGTIVTIVLLMTVLILGLVLVRTIFGGAVENIDNIDQAVKNEINKENPPPANHGQWGIRLYFYFYSILSRVHNHIQPG